MSSTTFTEYRGPDRLAGPGGTVRTVDGIEYWETGEPNRRYRILGIITDDRNDKPWFKLTMDGTVARVAKEHGGDAVIVLDASKRLTGLNAASGQADYRSGTRLAVVKYLP